jgi:cytochrome P450 / NADPH-cytochrome P450 reductase
MPAFGPAKIRGMFSSMTDIASQLLAKWEVSNMSCRCSSDSPVFSHDTEVMCYGRCTKYAVIYARVRFGPEYMIDPSEDFTRLAFDTVAL